MGSLDKLSKKLVNDGKQLSILETSDLCTDGKGVFSKAKYKLLTRKGKLELIIKFHITWCIVGVFPYEYLSSYDVLQDTSLPSIDQFDSKLGVGCQISIDDYKHAHDVWKEFGCRSFRDYMEIYCALDVILLAELFSNFKDNCKKVSYNLTF
jgi:hypothetical protein